MQTLITKPLMEKYLDEKIISYETRPSGQYIRREFNNTRSNIKIYTTGTMTITGPGELKIFTTLMNLTNEENTLGCDEVGVGDFFGPTVYCCVNLTSSALKYIGENHLKIKDSKKLTDEEIVSLYNNHLKNNIDYQIAVVFDCNIPDSLNSIEQKSYYHNQLVNYYSNCNYTVVDLYTTENNFHKVTEKLRLKWPDDLILETKADGKYYSVAIASIIARRYFVTEMDKLATKYNYSFPYGANVANEALIVKELLGKDEMANFCKTSFKTFKEL